VEVTYGKFAEEVNIDIVVPENEMWMIFKIEEGCSVAIEGDGCGQFFITQLSKSHSDLTCMIISRDPSTGGFFSVDASLPAIRHGGTRARVKTETNSYIEITRKVMR